MSSFINVRVNIFLFYQISDTSYFFINNKKNNNNLIRLDSVLRNYEEKKFNSRLFKKEMLKFFGLLLNVFDLMVVQLFRSLTS